MTVWWLVEGGWSCVIPGFLISWTAVLVGRTVGLAEGTGELLGGTCGIHMASGPGEREAMVWRAPTLGTQNRCGHDCM